MRRQDLQVFEDVGYIAERLPNVGITRLVATTAPTNSKPGYAHGCFWINTAGGAGTTFYVNTGTNLLTVWTNVL